MESVAIGQSHKKLTIIRYNGVRFALRRLNEMDWYIAADGVPIGTCHDNEPVKFILNWIANRTEGG